jgi:hypothetical protein
MPLRALNHGTGSSPKRLLGDRMISSNRVDERMNSFSQEVL